MADTPALSVQPTERNFTQEARATLVTELKDQDRATVTSPIDDLAQVSLTPDCRTQRGGFRYSAVAFRQLCRVMAPGLTPLVMDLAGARRRNPDADRDRFSLADAVHILNTVIRRRFRSTLDGLQMVRDTRTGVIEGVVGRGYRRLSNLELFERSEDVLRDYRQPVRFHHASLRGRWLVLRYRGDEVLFTPQSGDPYYWGFHFANSEIGDGAVRAAPVLVRGYCGNCALGNFSSGGRLIHAGKGFRKRFEILLLNVATRTPDPARLQAAVLRCISTPLGLTGPDDHNEKRFLELVRRLQTKAVPGGLARRIVRGTLLQSSFDREPSPSLRYVSPADWAQRTVYDLYNSMTRSARELPIVQQERLEQLAFALLLGKFTLGEKDGD